MSAVLNHSTLSRKAVSLNLELTDAVMPSSPRDPLVPPSTVLNSTHGHVRGVLGPYACRMNSAD